MTKFVQLFDRDLPLLTVLEMEQSYEGLDMDGYSAWLRINLDNGEISIGTMKKRSDFEMDFVVYDSPEYNFWVI